MRSNAFQGVSGHVKFAENSNDKPNLLKIQQVQQGSNVEVGLVQLDSTIAWIGNGTNAESWTAEDIDPPWRWEEAWILFPILLTLAICTPCCIGIYCGCKQFRHGAKDSKQS